MFRMFACGGAFLRANRGILLCTSLYSTTPASDQPSLASSDGQRLELDALRKKLKPLAIRVT